MHPTIGTLKNQLQAVSNTLRQPSTVDATLRQLQEDRWHAERQMAAVLEWVPTATAMLDDLTHQIEIKDARIAELEAQLAEGATPPALVADSGHPLDDITGYKRGQLRELNEELG